jgi:hypothetical protein
MLSSPVRPDLPSGSLPLSVATKILYAFLICPIRTTYKSVFHFFLAYQIIIPLKLRYTVICQWYVRNLGEPFSIRQQSVWLRCGRDGYDIINTSLFTK